ncbi:arginase family protein [Trinickia sp.]|uniref:arginase family protein n=1 Tax=Trinickia sp. TaxID=2571163 RepID=UPI003F814E67
MDIERYVVPFWVGQRRQGLLRVQSLDRRWSKVDLPWERATRVESVDGQLLRMRSLYRRFAQAIRQCAVRGAMPMAISGDCLVTAGMLAGLQQAGREPDRILWLDAHGDFHTWRTTGTGYIGGMPLAILTGHIRARHARDYALAQYVRAVGFKSYPARRIVLSDARDLDGGEREALFGSGVVLCEFGSLQARLRACIGACDTLYVHLDTDSIFDPRRLPALKYQVPGGPTVERMRDLFVRLTSYNVVAVSVSGWHEQLDPCNVTAKTILELLSIFEKGRRAAAGRRPIAP